MHSYLDLCYIVCHTKQADADQACFDKNIPWSETAASESKHCDCVNSLGLVSNLI